MTLDEANMPYKGHGKFEGQRMAVVAAYELWLEGFAGEEYSDAWEEVWCWSAFLGEAGFVYCCQNTAGFVFEISRDDFEREKRSWPK